jgi:hypothetical protein
MPAYVEIDTLETGSSEDGLDPEQPRTDEDYTAF